MRLLITIVSRESTRRSPDGRCFLLQGAQNVATKLLSHKTLQKGLRRTRPTSLVTRVAPVRHFDLRRLWPSHRLAHQRHLLYSQRRRDLVLF